MNEPTPNGISASGEAQIGADGRAETGEGTRRLWLMEKHGLLPIYHYHPTGELNFVEVYTEGLGGFIGSGPTLASAIDNALASSNPNPVSSPASSQEES